MVDATLKTHKFHDLSHFGMRVSVGVLLMVHSLGKFSPGGAGFFSSIGLPSEMAVIIGLLELVGGALLVAGILTRISSSLLAIEMLAIMVHLKKLQSFSGPNGLELELLVFVIVLTVAILGPGRISVSHAVRKLPRFLH